MEEELGRPIAEVFSSISERPIAAASLGQARTALPCLSVLNTCPTLRAPHLWANCA